jgi:SAM-dependent methyltransferase
VADNFDPVAHNRAAWDREVASGNEWTRPVGPDVIASARSGDWSVVLIGHEPVPREWFPAELDGAAVLCLASGGGQQGPVLSAAGAAVTVFDNSPRQLERDAEVAAREGLAIRTVLGDMRDLSAFPDASFDVVFNPVSNVFCPELAPVWRESFRVLRRGGILLAGFMNPTCSSSTSRRWSAAHSWRATRSRSARSTCPTPSGRSTTVTARWSSATR